MRVLLLASTLCACAPDAPIELVPTGAASSGTADTGTELTTWDSSVEGLVVGPDGDVLAGIQVTLCGTICQVEESGPDGVFRFEGPWPQINLLETLTYPGDDQAAAALEWSAAFDLLAIEPDEHRVLERPLRIHRVSTEPVGPGPQDLQLTSDLCVAFDADAVGIPFPAEEMRLGALPLPEEDWPSATGSWTTIKAWTFAVWGLHHEGGFQATATLVEPLPDGAEVAFLVADYVSGFRHGTFQVHDATLSPDGLTVSTLPDQGLDRTTLWVVATRTP